MTFYEFLEEFGVRESEVFSSGEKSVEQMNAEALVLEQKLTEEMVSPGGGQSIEYTSKAELNSMFVNVNRSAHNETHHLTDLCYSLKSLHKKDGTFDTNKDTFDKIEKYISVRNKLLDRMDGIEDRILSAGYGKRPEIIAQLQSNKEHLDDNKKNITELFKSIKK